MAKHRQPTRIENDARFEIRIPQAELEAAKAEAYKNHESVGAWVRRLIRDALRRANDEFR